MAIAAGCVSHPERDLFFLLPLPALAQGGGDSFSLLGVVKT